MKKIVVYLEQNQDGLFTSAYELANKAFTVAKNGDFKWIAVVMGQNSEAAAKQASVLGADKVICVENEAFTGNSCAPYAEMLRRIVAEENASYLFLENTVLGREISAAVAIRMNAALVNGCAGAEALDDGIAFFVPLENPDVFEKKVSGADVTVAAFESVSLKGMEAICYSPCEIVPVAADVASEPEFIVEEQEAKSVRRLEDATIVVAGGRGMGSEENFRDLYDLADILGASVAATRAAVFHGWAEESQQVGISAKSVAPKLYIACGISGATQHVDGMSRAEHVLSINLNSTAPYVGEADLSVVGNARSIVKKLVAALK